MPILVTCPSCKAQFNVSEKFAGKQGPCPKCKAKITVPDPSKVTTAAGEEIKVHGGDDYAGGAKSATGRPVLKPIEREDLKLSKAQIAVLATSVLAALVGAYFAGPFLRAPSSLPILLLIRGAPLFLISIPVVMLSYAVLRNEELDAFRGRSLIIRSLLCSAIYSAMWASFLFIPPDMVEELYGWLVIAPPLLLLGSGTAWMCFDFDFGTGAMHYCFYLVLTLLLGWLAGLQMPWAY